MLRIVDFEVYAEGVRSSVRDASPPTQAELLAIKYAQARRAHEQALAGDFAPSRENYVNWLTILRDNHASSVDDLLDYLVNPELWEPIPAQT